MRDFSYIIWDWNGTLLNDLSAALHAMNAMLSRRGLPALTLERYREIFGFPVRAFYRKAGFRLETEDWDAMAKEFHSLFLADKSIGLFSGAKEMLESFRKRGIRQSVLTVSEQSIIDAQISAFGIGACFEHVAGVHDLNGVSKRELGQGLLRTLPVPPSSIVMAGDTLHDAEVAKALGLSCVLIANGHQSKRRLLTSEFPVVSSLDEFLRVTGNHQAPF